MRCVGSRGGGKVKEIHGGGMRSEGGSFNKEISTQGNVSKQY